MNTLSDRLKFAIGRAGISQAELARVIDIKPAALQYLLSSNAQSSRFTFELAHALNVRTEWLAAGVGTMTAAEDPLHRLIIKYKRVPLLELEQIENWLQYNQANNSDYLLAPINLGDKSFAIKINDVSMKPVLNKGNEVIIDTARKPQDGGLVLVKLKYQDEIVFRKLSLNEHSHLLPYNFELYKPIKMGSQDIILGTAIEARVQL